MVEPSGRSVVLVTGMSGTGKSTALAALGRRGHRVVDTDEPGWIIEVETPYGVEPMWNVGRICDLLDGHRTGWLFLAGCVANQSAFHNRLDAVVLLSAPVEVILARVADRTNPFGSHTEERAKIAADLTQFEPMLRAGADHEIDATRSVTDVVTALEQVAIEVEKPRTRIPVVDGVAGICAGASVTRPAVFADGAGTACCKFLC